MTALTAREVKSKVIATMRPHEVDDFIVGETRRGGFIILTDSRVIEVYHSGGRVYVQEREFERNQGWTDFPLIEDTEG